MRPIARPQVALVNNVMPAHMERMGSLLGIAETKGAIYEALPDDGVAVVNADDAFAPWFMQRIGQRPVLRFGLENDAHIRASALVLDAAGASILGWTLAFASMAAGSVAALAAILLVGGPKAATPPSPKAARPPSPPPRR